MKREKALLILALLLFLSSIALTGYNTFKINEHEKKITEVEETANLTWNFVYMFHQQDFTILEESIKYESIY